MIATLTLEGIEKTSRRLTLSRILSLVFPKELEDFKNLLKQISDSLELSVQTLIVDLDGLDIGELQKLHDKYKKFSKYYDKWNDKYSSKNYFNDADVKNLFRSITKNLHKLENISYKYLIHDTQFTPADDYIKQGISQISRNVIGEKIATK